MQASKILTRLLLFSGIVLLGALVWKVGVRGVSDSLQLLGPWLAPFLLLNSVSVLLHTAGWSACFVGHSCSLRLWQLAFIRMAGSAINQVTPTADVGGEVVKVLLLHPSMPQSTATAAVTIGKSSSALAQMIYLACGIFFLMKRLSLPAELKRTVVLTLSLFTLGVLMLIVLQRYGGMSKLVQLIGRMGVIPSFFHRLQHRVTALESQWVIYYTSHPWRFARSVALHVLGFVSDAFRTYILFRLLLGDSAPALTDALLVAVAVSALQQIFFFVPGNIGTLEGIRFTVLSAFGVAEVYGFAFGLVARIESLCWNGIGLIAYALCTRWPLLLQPAASTNPFDMSLKKNPIDQ